MRRVVLSALVLCACPASSPKPRPYAAPEAQAIIDHIIGVRDRASSLNAETTTDVRMGKDRANVAVDMLAAWGGKLRFQAHDPNQATAADLGSDGHTYCMLDMHSNCGECGPATPENVGRLVRIPLEPDQVVGVLLGTAPILDGAATVEWDPGEGHEILSIKQGELVERIILDGIEHRWDVLDAELKKTGTTVWRLRHKDFRPVTTKEGQVVRLPSASLFEQAGDTVRILWRDQTIGAPLDDAKFRVTVPEGLKGCQ